MSTTSIKKNTIANYIGRGYTTVIGITIYPFYLSYLGPEAYGLVGFFVVLHAWLLMLDMGLSPMLARQAAYTRVHPVEFTNFRRILRSLEFIFAGISVSIIVGILAGNGWISSQWLKIENLEVGVVSYCISLMGIIFILRWFSGMYASGINGMESQVWLNTAKIAIVSLRFIGALAILHWVKADVSLFFEYQIGVAILEFVIFRWKLYRLLPLTTEKVGLLFSYRLLKPLLSFSFGIAYLSVIGIITLELDKLLLSNILSLTEYGYFALVIVVSNGIMQLSAPVNDALLPRMTSLLSSGKKQNVFILYRHATQIISVVMFSLAGMVAFFGEELLYVWTNNIDAAQWAAPVLFWYMLSYAIRPLLNLQYLLQSAYGDLKLQIKIGNIFFVVSLPLILFSAYTFGPIGTGITWLFMNLFHLLISPAIVHKKFAPGLQKKWLTEDILPILLMNFLVMAAVVNIPFNFENMSRILIFATLICSGCIVLTITSLGSSFMRGQFLKYLWIIRNKISESI